MTYCSNCGCKIEGNDLFCPDCGTKVNQTLNENGNKERVNQTFQNVKSITDQINFAEIITTFKTSALNPVSGGKHFVAKAQKNHVIIIAIILTFLQGILGIWRINQIISNLQTIVTKFVLSLSSLAGLFGQSSSFRFDFSDLSILNQTIEEFKFLIKIPYLKIFIGNCGIYLIGVFVLFVFIYLGISIFSKVKYTPFTLFKTVLISTLPILTCEIISILFSYFSLYLGMSFIILGALISITTLAVIVKESLQIKGDLSVLIVSISSLIALVAFYIAFQNFIFSDLSSLIKSTINLY